MKTTSTLAPIIIGAIVTIYRGMNGHFPKRRLKKPYIYVWRLITWGALAVIINSYVLRPFFTWWDSVIGMLNYLIWG